MEDHTVQIEPFDSQNEEIFQFLNEKKEENKNTRRFEIFYLLYMIAVNLILIFFPVLLGKENFSLKQKISNFAYNSLCILIVLLGFFFLYSNQKFPKFLSFFRFFLLIKVNLDFFNLIYLTPNTYGKEIFMIFYLLAFLNLITLIFFNCRLYIEIKKFSILLFLIVYIPISILSCYLFSFVTDKENFMELISLELVKIIFYLVILMIHFYKLKINNSKQEFQSRIKFLEELSHFLMEYLKSSKSNGFLIIENSQNLFYNQIYFQNFLIKNTNKETEKFRKSTKVSNSKNFSKLSSIEGITPIPEITPINRKNRKQKTHIPQFFNQFEEFKLIDDKIPKFQNFSSKNVRHPKKKKLSLSCKCISKHTSKISLNNLSREDNVTVEVDTNLIKVNVDVNIKSSQNFRNPSRKTYSSINFRNKKKLDKIKEEESETESEIDCDNVNMTEMVNCKKANMQVVKSIPNKNLKKSESYLSIKERIYSSPSNSSDDFDEVSQEVINELNITTSNQNNIEQYSQIKRINSNSSQPTVVKNSIGFDNNFYQDEFFKNNNNSNNRFSFENNNSNKSYTKKDLTINSPRHSEVRSSRFNPTRNNHENLNNKIISNSIPPTNNIINSQINYNNNYNFNIYNSNRKESSGKNIHLHIIHTENNDENIPINIKRKQSNKINKRPFKITENIEKGGDYKNNETKFFGSLFIENLNCESVKILSFSDTHEYFNSEIKKKIGKGIFFDKFLIELSELIRGRNDQANLYDLGPYSISIRNSKSNQELDDLDDSNTDKKYITLSVKMLNCFYPKLTTKEENICVIILKDYTAPVQPVLEINNRKITDIISQIPELLKKRNIQQQMPNYTSENSNNKIIEKEYLLNSPRMNNKNLTHPQLEKLQNMEPKAIIHRSIYKNKSNYKLNSVDYKKVQSHEMTTADHIRSEKASIQFKSKLNKNIIFNNSNNNQTGTNQITKKYQRYSPSCSNSQPHHLFLAKISALLHDFKHIVLDNTFFFKYLIKQYGIALKMEDLVYIKTMKKYVQFLVRNLTLFFNDQNNFLKGDINENNKPVDILLLLDNLIAVFNRRLQFENASSNKNQLAYTKFNKNIKIFHKVSDRSNPNYQKLISNKNLLTSVFYNLISNSYKETDEGEIYAETSINDLKKEILVKIIDTGNGMPESVKKKWGIPFHKYGEQAGSGLGQFIIETVKNSLNLFIPKPEDNPCGRGTIISVYIPLEETSNSHNNKQFSSSNLSIITRKETFRHQFNQEEKQGLENEIIRKDGSKCAKSLHYENFVENIKIILPENYNVHNLLVFDDDSFVLRVFQEKVEKDLKFNSMRLKFQFVYVKNFESFFEEFYKMLSSPKKVFDFFILDQNIGLNMKGVDVAEIVCKIYEAYNLYDKRLFNFIFMTEESHLCNYYKQSTKHFNKYAEKILHNGENIFGKSEMKFIKNKILELIEKN